MGINLGAFIGPLICRLPRPSESTGTLASPRAGVGMASRPDAVRARPQAGLQPAIGAPRGRRPTVTGAAAQGRPHRRDGPVSGLRRFTAAEWKRIGAIVVLFLVATLFWGAYEQAGSTLTLFADRHTQLEVVRLLVPVVVVPVGAADLRDPPRAGVRLALDSARHARAVGAGEVRARPALHVAVVPRRSCPRADGQAEGVRVSPWWLVASYCISELGELCLSPVGLSAVTKLAPVRILGLMMGVWFLSNAFGNKLAGYAAGFVSSMPLSSLFGDGGRRPGGRRPCSCSSCSKPISG